LTGISDGYRPRLCKNAGSVLKSALLLKICSSLGQSADLKFAQERDFCSVSDHQTGLKTFLHRAVAGAECNTVIELTLEHHAG
jgi:hypothetical protein